MMEPINTQAVLARRSSSKPAEQKQGKRAEEPIAKIDFSYNSVLGFGWSNLFQRIRGKKAPGSM